MVVLTNQFELRFAPSRARPVDASISTVGDVISISVVAPRSSWSAVDEWPQSIELET